MMRILVGMPDPASRGGLNACEPPFVAALRGLGVDVLETTWIYGDELQATALATRVKRVARTAWQLRRILRGARFDLVHLNTSFDTKTVLRDAFTLALLGRSTPPLFLKIHGSDPELLTAARLPIRALARFALGRVTEIGVLSRMQREQFIAAGLPAEKLTVVRNARPEPPATARSRESFLDVYGLPASTPLLLFISRLVAKKGLLDAVHACASLRERGKRFVLCCVGEGPARSEAEAEAARLRLGDSVRFFGYLPESEASAFYGHSDVLVFPSLANEGLPVVILNALAAGLPIVTTRARGAIDYLSEPETCLWVEPHRPDQLAARVAELLENDEMRAAMSERAREAARLFEPRVVAQEYLGLYQRLVARRSESAPTEVAHADARNPGAETRT